MRKIWLKLVCFILTLCCALPLAACGGSGSVVYIDVDGGGDTANFNTSPSMTPSPTNPFPYNTLATLITEWEAKNPGYKIRLRRTSYGGDRATLEPLLRGKNAPDIIYQNGSVISMDLGKGYYVDMKNYLEKPNPYNGDKTWKEVYQAAELAGTVAEDGGYYYINLERYAAGIIYNKKLFTENNIKVPETYEEFMQAQAALSKIAGVTPFLSDYNWYDIVIETNLFSPYIDILDLDGDRHIGVEELCRGYYKQIWDVTQSAESDFNAGLRTAYETYIDIICEKKMYEPLGSSGYDPITTFIMGNVGMIEATSEAMRKIYYDQDKGFEVGVIGYPHIALGAYKNDNYATGAGYGVRRGSAGTATSWWVTSTAEKKGTVEKCVDFLMFLTAPANNNRLIGDLKGAIPLDPNATVDDYLQPLVDMYKADLQNENLFSWSGICSWQVLGLDYNSYFNQQINALVAKRNPSTGIVPDSSKRETVTNIKNQTRIKILELIEEMQFDTSRW